MGLRISDRHLKSEVTHLVARIEDEIAAMVREGVLTSMASDDILQKLAAVRRRLDSAESANLAAEEIRRLISTAAGSGPSRPPTSFTEIDRLLSLL